MADAPTQSPVEDYARHAILDERARVAPLINGFRIMAMVVAIAVMWTNNQIRVGSIGPSLPLMAVWLAAAVLLHAVTRSSAARARASVAFIPLVDMPMLFALFAQLIFRLDAGGHPQDAPAAAVLSLILFALLIFITGGLVERWYTMATAGIAVVLQLTLHIRAGVDATVTLGSVMSLFFAAIATTTVSARILRLVSAAVSEQQRHDRLSRYFSPQVIDHLESGGGDTVDEFGQSQGATHEVTVLFADLRGFTKLADRLSEREVVDQLNEFHEIMVDVLFEHDGTLDKYLGDGLMAYFGAPVPSRDHADRAVRCAVAMQRAIAELNERRNARNQSALRVGIGIHTGPVILGDIGAARRREFTAIGHAVNLAARLEEQTKATGFSVLISEDTAARVTAELVPAGAVEIRGLESSMQTFTVAEPS